MAGKEQGKKILTQKKIWKKYQHKKIYINKIKKRKKNPVAHLNNPQNDNLGRG
jgi:hypothetical protein